MYICHPTKSHLYTFVSSYRTYTPFRWEDNKQEQEAESESPIGRPLTSTPVVPPGTTTSSGFPTGVYEANIQSYYQAPPKVSPQHIILLYLPIQHILLSLGKAPLAMDSPLKVSPQLGSP